MSLNICLGLRDMPKNIIVPCKKYASKGVTLMMNMMTILYRQLYRCRDFLLLSFEAEEELASGNFTPPSNVPAIS